MVQTLTAQERKNVTTSALHELRKKGDLPAVIYGTKQESTPITVDLKALKKIILSEGRNGIINIKLNGKQHNVMMKDYQYDPLKNEYVHADFMTINLSEDISANVPLKLTGVPKGVKDYGGILQQAIYELNVTAKPKEIPENIEVDVSEFNIGDTLTIENITKDLSIAVNHEFDDVVASIQTPRVEEEKIDDSVATEGQEEELV